MTETRNASDWRPDQNGGPEPPGTRGGLEHRPMGWWGMALTVMVLAAVYAAMYFTYVYMRVSSLQWPPEGISAPSLRTAGLSAAALGASALAIWLSQRVALAGLAGAIILAGAHIWLVVADWAQPGFDPSAHAYGSASVVLPALHLSFVAIGMLIAAVLAALTLKGPGPQHHVGLRSLALWWYAVAVGGLLLLALVYGIPHVWSDPWPAA